MKRFLLTVLVLALSVSGLFAADYYIRDYEVSVEVGNDGVHHIEEYLAVVFDGNHHGIVREIPLDYRDYNGKTLARVKNISCSEKYTTSYDNGYLVMKIGDANKTVNGMVEYTITYDYDLGADFNEGYDEIYLNVIGTDWECPIYYAYFAIYLPYVPHEEWSGPEDYFNYVLNNAHLTSGSYGSDDFDWINGRGYLYYDDEDEGSLLIEGYMSGLGPYEGIAIRLDLPEGWYQGAREPWDHTDAMKIINPVVCILLLILALTLWILYGRDNVPIIVARFEPPKGFSPLMVGYVADSTVDDKDIISMLFYWADEGLLSMEEKSGKKYEFTKLKDIEAYAIESGKDIPQFEVKLFNGFFKGCDVGDSVKFKDLEKNSFFQTIVDTKMATKKFFKGKRALQDGKSRRMAILVSLLSLFPLLTLTLRVALYEYVDVFFAFTHMGLGFLLFFINLAAFDSLFRSWHLRKTNIPACIFRFIVPVLFVFVFFLFEEIMNERIDVLQTILSVGCSTMMALLGAITDRRTKYGDEVLEETLGYREFIDKAEIDQLKMMIESDPDFYYRTLSYAVVLGLENTWAKKFKDIPLRQPEWITGTDVVDAIFWSHLIRNMSTSIPAASIPKSSISGSPGSHAGGGGFHSSGFSGGGFGGGGGHAW